MGKEYVLKRHLHEVTLIVDALESEKERASKMIAKYGNRWAVYDRVSRTFSHIGEGKRFCQNKVKELNE